MMVKAQRASRGWRDSAQSLRVDQSGSNNNNSLLSPLMGNGSLFPLFYAESRLVEKYYARARRSLERIFSVLLSLVVGERDKGDERATDYGWRRQGRCSSSSLPDDPGPPDIPS
jgi:hypothetical protein